MGDATSRPELLWNLLDDASASELGDANERIRDPGAVWMLPLSVDRHISINPRTLDEAFLPTELGAFGRSMLMLLLRVAHDYSSTIGRKLSGDLPALAENGYHGPPALLRIETVTEDPDIVRDEQLQGAAPFAPVLAPSSDSNASLAEALKSAAERVRYIDPNKRAFMRSMGEHVPTVAVRFWFFFMYDREILDPARRLGKMLNENEASYYEFVGLGGGRASGKGDVSEWGATQHGVNVSRLLRSPATFAAVCDSLLYKDIACTHKSVLKKINDPRTPFHENPTNPRFTLNPAFLLSKHRVDPATRARARKIANYFNAESKEWRFPLPDHVVRVANHDLVPQRVTARFAPRYQAEHVHTALLLRPARTTGKRQAPPSDPDDDDDDDPPMDVDRARVYGAAPNGDHRAFDTALLSRESHQSAAAVALREAYDSDSSTSRSALHALRAEGARRRYDFDQACIGSSEPMSRVQRRAALLDLQRSLLRAYVDTCCAPDSDMSKASLACTRWLNEQRDETGAFKWLGGYRPLIDGRLTIFGSWVALFFMRLEIGALVSTSHSVLFSVLFGNFDASRFSYDLHMHNMFHGPAATSKSFCLKLLARLYVEGTTEDLTSFSPLSWTGGENLSKSVFIWDETPMEALKTAKNSNSDELERTVKTLLTENKFVRRVTEVDSNAAVKRRVVTYRTEVMATWNFSWNWTVKEISKPIASRQNLHKFLTRRRPGRDPEDFSNIEQSKTARSRANEKLLEHQVRALQTMHSLVNDFVTIFLLSEPTLEVLSVCQPLFVASMRDSFCLEVPTRTVQRMGIFTRILVITHALEVLYSLPSSRYYKKPFTYESLLDLDPLLHDSEEIVEFVFDFFRDQCHDEEGRHVLDTFREKFKADKRSVGQKYYNEKTVLCTSSSSSSSEKKNSRNQPAAYGRVTNIDNGAVPPKTDHKDKFWSYYNVGSNIYDLRDAIVAMGKGQSVELDKQGTLEVLYRLKDTSFLGYRYKYVTNTIVPVKEEGRKRWMAAFREQDSYFVHVDLFNDERDAVDASIAACWNKYTVGDATHISARRLDWNYPHLMKLRTPEPNPNYEILHRNVILASTELAKAAFAREPDEIARGQPYDREAGENVDKNGATTINESLNARSQRVRAHLLHMDEQRDGGKGGPGDFSALDQWARQNYVGAEIRRYPDGYKIPANPAKGPGVDNDNDDDEDDF